MKQRICILSVLSLLLLLTAFAAGITPADVPEILFCTRYCDENGANRSIMLLAQDGHCYASADPDLCDMPYEILAAELLAGSEKLHQMAQSCTPGEAAAMWQKFRRSVQNGVPELDVPNAMPAVEAPETRWVGLYPGEDGCLREALLHEETRMTQIRSTSGTLNDVYDWYSLLFAQSVMN